MKHIARALAAQGRGPDTELLHVTKNELKYLDGVARAHGLGSLTKNPKTGLMEASLFNTLLPILGGIGGAALLGPWGAALGSGLGSKLGGGSDNDMLRSAALGGLGGYMSGAQGALLAPEAQAAAQAGTQAAVGAGESQAGMLAAQEAGLGAAQGAPMGLPAGGMQATGGMPSAGVDMYAPAAPNTNPWAVQQAPSAPPALPPGGMQATGAQTPDFMQGTPAPEAPGMWDKTVDWAGRNPMLAASLGIGAYGVAKKALDGPRKPRTRQVELRGASHSNRTYTGGTGSGPGEREYFANNDLGYTSDPSTYRTEEYAEGGAVAPTQPVFQPVQMPETGAPIQQPAWQPSVFSGVPAAAAQQQRQASMDPNTMQSMDIADTPAFQQWQQQNQAARAAMARPQQQATAPQQQATAPQQPMPAQLTYSQLAKQGVDAQAARDAEKAAADKAAADAEAARIVGIRIAPNGRITPPGTIRPPGSPAFAKGGILNLRKHSQRLDPMFLQGEGDGMSDSIPAYIDGAGKRPHEPIKVTDGEYIVPADAVAHAGNGSSNAGAKKMDKMVASLRKARTGKTKQAPQINASKHIPK